MLWGSTAATSATGGGLFESLREHNKQLAQQAEQARDLCQEWDPWASMEVDIQEAAESGNRYAQRQLGYAYEFGCRVPRSHSTAEEWYTKAAWQGDTVAMYFLGLLLGERNTPVTNPKEGYAWLSVARARGQKEAGEGMQWLLESAGWAWDGPMLGKAEARAAEIWEELGR